MYIPRQFLMEERATIGRFLREHAFGQLISHCEGQLFSSHLLFEADENLTTLGTHMARANPQHRAIEGQEVLVTFQGPHAYISPTWYHSPGVPTWNYQVVHIYGVASVSEDPDALRARVMQLADRYESGNTQRWSGEFRQEVLAAIVGIEIAVTDVQCKFKLSQNRPEVDRRTVAAQLRSLGEHALADAMEGAPAAPANKGAG